MNGSQSREPFNTQINLEHRYKTATFVLVIRKQWLERVL